MVRALLILSVLAAGGLLAWYLADGDAARTMREAERAAAGPAPAVEAAGGEASGEVSVEADGATAELRGLVTGDDAQPLAGVQVTVPLGNDEPPLRAETDGSGRFRLDVRAEPWVFLRLRHPDYIALESGARTAFDNEFQLERGARFTVLVLGPDGKPVEGAQVKASHDVSSSYGRVYWGSSMRSLGEGVTGADGKIVIGAVPATPFELRVAHDSYASHREELDLGELRPVEHVVRLDEGGRIEGAVFGPEGEPLAAAIVEAGDRSAETDASGHYAVERVRVGFVEVRASRDGFGPSYFGEKIGWNEAVPVEVRAGETTAPIDVHLGKPSYVTGQVTDEKGQPLDDAHLYVQVWGGYGRESEFKTGKDGRFRAGPFSVFRRAEAHVHARKDGYQYKNSGGEPIDPGKSVDVGTLKLARGAVVRGRCVDAEGGPVAGAMVSTAPGNGSTRSDADGQFELTDVPTGSIVVLAQGDEQVSPREPLDIAQNAVVAGLVLRMVPPLTISGRVRTEDGKPRAEIYLNARAMALPDAVRNWSAWIDSTDEEGRYEIGGLAPGRYEVAVYGYGGNSFWGAPKGDPKVVEAGATEVDFEYPYTGGIVTAKVVSKRSGRPLDEFRFSTIRYRGFLPNFDDVGQRQDSGGVFRFEFAEEGSWAIDFRAKGHASHRTPKFELKKGEERDLGTIRLGDGGVIEGRVVDAQAQPVPFTRLNILSPKFETNDEEPFTGMDGTFRVRGVSPGVYIVFAVSPSHPVGMVKNVFVREGETARVEVKFAERAPLEVIVQGDDGRPLKGAELFWTFPEIAPLNSKMVRSSIPPGYGDNESDQDGRILQHGLPAGPVTLFVEAKGFMPATKQVRLEAGNPTRLEIRLDRKN